jgi:hypothetical protein
MMVDPRWWRSSTHVVRDLLEPVTPFLHIGETDCVAGHIGFELRCAERKFISLRCRVSSNLGDPDQTAVVFSENDLLC